MGKEERIKALTALYYSNPKVCEAIVNFSKDREVVPRYYEGFGTRPDTMQYPSDVMGAVRKGATSFHASEEIWEDPFRLSSEITQREMNEIRKGWDLLIDVDSKYLDISKVLTVLLLETLEEYGVQNYGVKFSGSKGFHIIVSGRAFPSEFGGQKMSESFPEWPRAICEYLTHVTRREFNKRVRSVLGDIEKMKERSDGKNVTEVLCPECSRPASRGSLISLKCGVCGTEIQRKNMKITKKRLKCIQDDCAGVFGISKEDEYFECKYCSGVSSINKMVSSGMGKIIYSKEARSAGDYSGEMEEEHSGVYHGASDLVLVAPRHLFRSPYSLHEKTALASVVLTKKEVVNFTPMDADPMKVLVKDFLPKNEEGEIGRLLSEALSWKRSQKEFDDEIEGEKYKGKKFKEIEMEGVTEDMFPKPIKKLLKGLDEGRKRGLFVLLTFFKSVGFSAEEIVNRIKKWNEKNEPPLREGYVRSQIDWHMRQKKKILPPNYSNDSFYADLGILDGKPKVKNPLVEVRKELWKSKMGKKD
jgi:hypothetical protein